MKITSLFLLLLLNVCSISAQTKLGLRANSAPWQIPYYDTLNAQVSRQIISDHLLNPAFTIQFNNSLANLKQIGVETIVCLRFPTDALDSQGSDRCPVLDPADLDSTLSNVEDFLLGIADNLDYVQIQNEPVFGPGKYIETLPGGDLIHLGYYGYQWMDTLASSLNEIIVSNGLNVEVVGPAFHNVEDALDLNTPQSNPITFIRAPGDTVFAGTLTTDSFSKAFEEMMMDVSLERCDLIDVHLNVDGLSEIDARMTHLDSLQILRGASVALPYTTLEWSQAFEKEELINNNPGYHQFLDDAYNGLVTDEEWRNFILDTLDYDTTFIQDAFCKFQEYNLVHACYAGLIMYGSPSDDFAQIFSTVALLTNEVTSTIQRNEPFFSLYQNVDTNCGLSLPDTEQFTNEFIVFPNPAEDYVRITLPKKIDKAVVSMYSIQGNLIDSQSVDHQAEVNISKLKKGVYVVVIEDGIKRYVVRFTKV